MERNQDWSKDRASLGFISNVNMGFEMPLIHNIQLKILKYGEKKY